MSGPFYTAQVDPTENTFNPAVHNREDLTVFQFQLEHKEGQKPTLSLTVANPRLGLLRTGAKRYIWFSWFDGTTIQPLFFGRIVGLPSDLMGEKIQIDFIADPVNYLAQKQAIAEAKKIRPYYDPIFLDDAHRDDPDSILEGWPERWHISRIALGSPNAVTTSHILEGEGGTADFLESEVPYSSVKMSSSQAPKTIVHVEAKVAWKQKYTGTINFGQRTFESLTGDGFLSDWPKPGAGLSGGWSVADSSVADIGNISNSPTVSYSVSWQNKEKKHADGDTMSLNVNASAPAFVGIAGLDRGTITSYTYQPGFLDAFAVDDDGNYDPTNIGMSLEVQYGFTAAWTIVGTLALQYVADRDRTETIEFDLTSDIQEMVTAPDVPTFIEILQLNGQNVDTGVLNIEEWLSVAGKAVTVGTLVRVEASVSPLIPQANYQLAIVAGTASAVGAEPTFSGTMGFQTVDNSVTWVSLGTTLNNATQDWAPISVFGEGSVIQPVAPKWLWYYQLYSTFPRPTTGASIALGQVIRSVSGYFFVCTSSGTAVPASGTVIEPSWNFTRGTTTLDGSALWTCIGTTIADGATFWLQTHSPGGTTGSLLPAFGAFSVGTTISDGTAVWYSLGRQGNYIASPIGDSSRRSYFPTDRGRWSLEYCLQMASNHLMMSARCVTIEWDCLPTRIPALNLRMNARIFDPRIPGGYAWGKITQYALQGDGAQGTIIGHVTAECSIGKESVISSAAGTNDYVDASYVESGYYVSIGNIVLLPNESVGYSVPVDSPDDDGLIFPLTYATAVITDEVVGSDTAQGTAARAQISALSASTTSATNLAIAAGANPTGLQGAKTTFDLSSTPKYWHLVLRPVSGLKFDAIYNITTTKLSLPKGIDMGAT